MDDLKNETKEYQDFVNKFKPKKTTDDCCTPPNVYEAVKDWTVKKYDLEGMKILRPFWPGADYTAENYDEDIVVIDNPPFSILTKICKFYMERNIPFFLFAPALTLFSIGTGLANYVATGATITYDNGAVVKTSFVTNLGNVKLATAPDLRKAIIEADAENKSKNEHPKYQYPNEVFTPSSLDMLSIRGIDLEVDEKDCHFIRSLKSQRKKGKSIFGAGFLLSEKAAAEKAAATVWELSEEEKKIIQELGR